MRSATFEQRRQPKPAAEARGGAEHPLQALAASSPAVSYVGSLQRMADSRPVLQRLLNDGERGPLQTLALGLEGRIDAATGGLPDVIQQAYGEDHPLIEPIRAELVRIRAAYGTDDNADITAKLNGYQAGVVALETNIAAHLPRLQAVARVWTTFSGELGDLTEDLEALAADVYKAKATAEQINTFDRKLQRKVALDSKAMTALRKSNVLGAANRVRDYASLGYVTINSLNSFYCSSYDTAQDDFGAAASLENNTTSGAMQWLREWEFHIHGSAVRAGGQGTPVTGFTIKTGHIKPSKLLKTTGVSITVDDQALLGGVVANSQGTVVRWANSKRGAPVLAKQ
jgi:hypothetical protein